MIISLQGGKMRKLGKFLFKYPLIGWITYGILLFTGWILMIFSPLYYILILGGLLIILGIIWLGIYFLVIREKFIWTCKKCGKISYVEKKYCPTCGGQMYIAMKENVIPRCPNGHKVDEWDKYCPTCGAKID